GTARRVPPQARTGNTPPKRTSTTIASAGSKLLLRKRMAKAQAQRISPIARMGTGENGWEQVVMVCTSTDSMQCRESWIQEISIENLLRRLGLKCQICVPRLPECLFSCHLWKCFPESGCSRF